MSVRPALRPHLAELASKATQRLSSWTQARSGAPLALVAVLVAAGCGSSRADAPQVSGWTRVELRMPEGAESARPLDLNQRGDMVGVMFAPGRDGRASAVHWDRRVPVVLPDLGGNHSGAEAINERGQIVGWSLTPERGENHAVLWENGSARDLGPGSAVAISEGGVVIGMRSFPDDRPGAGFLWSDGKRTELDFWPLALNEQRQVVGIRTVDRWSARVPDAWPWDYAATPVRWEKGKVTELPGLTEPSLGSAETINESGQAAGVVMVAGGAQHLLIWDGDDLHDLGVVAPTPGDDWLTVVASGPYMNDRGDVSVSTSDEGGYRYAGTGGFFARDGELTSLPEIDTVYGINDQGLVLGKGPAGAAVWADGKRYPLPGGAESVPSGINRRGDVIGSDNGWPTLWRMRPASSG